MPTTEFTVSDDAWTQIGSGPLLVDSRATSNAFLHFGEVSPPIDTTAYHVLTWPDGFSYGGPAKCFARAAKGDVSLVVTEGS